MGEVPEAEGAAPEVFESAIQGFGGPVPRAGQVEVGEDVGGPLPQGAAEGDDLGQGAGTPLPIASMTACMRVLPLALSGSR